MGIIIGDIFLLLLGFLLLTVGANYLVKGAVELAHKYHLPEILIGMTVLAFGTSLPELIVNVIAAYRGYSDIVFSTIIGANIFNLYAILGLVGIIFPITLKNVVIFREIPLMILVTIIIILVTNDQLLFDAETNIIDRKEGAFLLFCFILFLILIYFNLRKSGFNRIDFEDKTPESSNLKTFIWIAGGTIATAFGGNLIVDEGTKLIQYFEITQRFFGITIVAVFTSLPELATSAVAVYQRKPSLAFGNILGSTIFNFLFVLGLAAIVKELPYNKGLNFDLNFFLFGTCLLFVGMFSGKMKRLDRWQSFFFLLFFVAYIYFVVVRL